MLPDRNQSILSRCLLADAEESAKRSARRARIKALKTELARKSSELANLSKRKDADSKKRADALKAQCEGSRRSIAELEAITDPPRMTGAALKAFLRANPFVDWKDHPVSPPKAATIAQHDAAIDAATAKGKRLRRTAQPYDEALTRGLAAIDALAARGEPDVAALFNGGPLRLPNLALAGNAGHMRQIPDGAALLAWLFRDTLRERVEALIDFAAPDEAMPAKDKRAALAALEAEILQLHRERAVLVERGVAEGLTLHHRPDAPPEAVLQISAA